MSEKILQYKALKRAYRNVNLYVFFELIEIADNKGTITLTKKVREDIKFSLDMWSNQGKRISVRTIINCIYELHRNGYIQRISNNVYQLNPLLVEIRG